MIHLKKAHICKTNEITRNNRHSQKQLKDTLSFETHTLNITVSVKYDHTLSGMGALEQFLLGQGLRDSLLLGGPTVPELEQKSPVPAPPSRCYQSSIQRAAKRKIHKVFSVIIYYHGHCSQKHLCKMHSKRYNDAMCR